MRLEKKYAADNLPCAHSRGAVAGIGIVLLLTLAGCQTLETTYYESSGLGDIEERAAIKSRVSTLFLASDFDALEGIAEQFRRTESRTPSGVWMLGQFYDGIADAMPTTVDRSSRWPELIRIANQWIREYPDSPTPYIAKSYVLHQYAWTYRGRGFAREVDPGNMARFKELISRSKVVIEESPEIAKSDPEYYAHLINLQRAEGAPKSVFRETLTEGLDEFPDYDEIYFRASSFLSPAWHGSRQEVEDLALDAVERTKSNRGYELYARIYWATPRLPSGFLFEKSPAQWKFMAIGMTDVLNRYPDQWNIQHFALFACAREDPSTLTRMFDQLEEPVIMDAWRHPSVFRNCKNWYESVADQHRF